MLKATVALAVTTFAALLLLSSATTPAIAGPSCDVDPTIDAQERELLRLINQHRAENGLGSLSLSDTLNRAAAWKSAHMANNDYFGHVDAGLGRAFDDRIRDCGYGENAWLGENIAAGHSSAAATFEQWRSSAGHNSNMLSDNFAAIGIGRARHSDSEFDWYWTTEFGGIADGYSPPASLPDGAGDVSCDGATDSIDAALLLQFNADLVGSLPCPDGADVNNDGAVTATDAALILQFAAGVIA